MRLTPCILGTACVPWNDDYTLAEGIFRRQVRHLLSVGFENLYVFGTAGEGHAVTDAQFRQIAEIFFAEMRASAGLCQLGIIGLSVPQVKARIEVGLEIGYRTFQLSLPSWGALNDRELRTFFDEILGGYPQAQFLHYNISRGLRVLSGRELAAIAADHPNLVATKSGSQSIANDLGLMTFAPELCHFFTEQDYAFASRYGACGLLISISSIRPERTHELFAAGQRRDEEALTRLSRELYTILQALFACAASGQHMDGAYDKLYSKIADSDFPLRLLPPYQSSTDEEWRGFVEKLRSIDPAWVGEEAKADV
ncbi:MAG: dihydrodipicolinate synthase family protein [Armatimonadota bacterium]